MSFIHTTTTFDLIEGLSVTGLAQGVLILVYIAFRVRNWREASLAAVYFLALSAAFALQFALRLDEYEQPIRLAQWLVWSLSPPLCYLLVLQMARGASPSFRQFWVLALTPVSLLAATLLKNIGVATGFFQWLYWMSSISGSISLLVLWGHKSLFDALRKEKSGRERYWLALTLVTANAGVVGINLLRSAGNLPGEDADALLIVLGLAFVYLASTAMFRIFPAPVRLHAAPQGDLSPEERLIAGKVKNLMELDKLYHEPAFSRSDLARELSVSESVLSRVINVAFGKSFPRFLSEFRVADAKRMLLNQEIPVQVVAFEVGFNSLASFNRVFREITGLTPTQYRLEAEK